MGLTNFAFATPDFLSEFNRAYPGVNGKCTVCHTVPPKFNLYGKSVSEALNNTEDGLVTVALLKKLEDLDADGDGVSNITEIKQGSEPGNEASKAAVKQMGTGFGESVPKHSFHPALVHFPVALIAFAAFFEFWGRRKKMDAMRQASHWNLAAGLLLSVVTIATGIAAWLRGGFTLEGNLLFHLILASASVIISFVAYLQRQKPSYLLIVGLGAILVLAAGHWGGLMVYGE